uniref:Uncharacterized protein n=1 Tax=Vespula pensylvanica TaxID=30213 RepID=A0A834P2D1_VESPE|nr:hypothetical protein H0235_007989 [Vespula pensylvanica]
MAISFDGEMLNKTVQWKSPEARGKRQSVSLLRNGWVSFYENRVYHKREIAETVSYFDRVTADCADCLIRHEDGNCNIVTTVIPQRFRISREVLREKQRKYGVSRMEDYSLETARLWFLHFDEFPLLLISL